MKPDAMGFILWSGSPRCVEPSWLREFLPEVPRTVRKVGVFVDPDPGEVRRIVRDTGLDAVQIHASDAIRRYDDLPCDLWHAVHADRHPPGAAAPAFVDAYLIDTYSKDSPGGTGRTGNWEASRRFVLDHDRPVLLAGGLKPENVREAVRIVRPFGVDVSSGVESEPGKKNLFRVKEFIHRCRQL